MTPAFDANAGAISGAEIGAGETATVSRANSATEFAGC